VFLRAKTLPVATLLAGHPDVRMILKGHVLVQRTMKGADDAGVWSLASPAENVISADSFLQELQAKDPVFLNAFKSGFYCFLIPQDSTLWAQLGNRPKVQVPEDPGSVKGDPETAFSPPSMVLEQISCSFENIVAPLQARGKSNASHHYIGSQPKYWQISGTFTNDGDRGALKDFTKRVDELASTYKGKLDGSPFGGFAIVENEFFHFMGTKYLIPLSYRADTVQEFPGTCRFEMSFVEFDNTQRDAEKFEDLFRGVPLDPIFSQESQNDPIGVRYIRQKELHRRLRATEIYPDLALPTHSQLSTWLEDIKNGRVWDFQKNAPFPAYDYIDPSLGGTGWQWTTEPDPREGALAELLSTNRVIHLPNEFLDHPGPNELPRRFADPDFYCSPSMVSGEVFVERAIQGAKQGRMLLYDPYGAEAVISPGDRLNETRITKDPQQTIQHAKESIDTKSFISPLGAARCLVDEVREKNLGVGGAGGLPIATSDNKSATFTIPEARPGDTFRKGSVPIDDGGSKQDRIARYGPIAAAAARQVGIPPDLLFGLIEQESQWKATAGSSAGAQGLGQLTGPTARALGVANIEDPVENVFASARYLKGQLDTFGNETLALAAYNAGPGAVRRAGNQVPAFKETQNYVRIVQENRAHYRTAGLPADPGTVKFTVNTIDPSVKREANQLMKEFNSGNGYRDVDILPYVIGRGKDPSKTFIPESWLVQTHNDPTDTTNKGLLQKIVSFNPAEALFPGTAWYVIRQEHITEFAQALRQHIAAIPVQRIPFRVAGQYQYENGHPALPDHAPTLYQAFHDPTNGRDMFHDLRQSFIQGRLLAAFPSFYVALVDGGRWLRVWRLYDHVYGMHAVTKIAVHRTRKGPVETALVGFSNMYGHLTAQAQEISRIQQQRTTEVWSAEALRRGLQGFIQFDDETKLMWAQHLNSLMLKAGTRLHIRMGYGADPSELPIVFNGTISECPVTEGEIEVVALSDGIELTNDLAPTDLQGAMPVSRYNSLLGEGLNPRELVMSFMAPNTAAESISNLLGQRLSPIFYFNFRNAYGIEHYGSQIRSDLQADDGEIGINVYNAESSVPFNSSTAWDSTLRIFQFWRWDQDQKLIGINMANATPWRIFETVRKTVPDYILYSHPFELRSTLFLGKGWFPFFYRYRDDVESEFTKADLTFLKKEAFFDWKPFQQFFIVSSDYNLLDNQVIADESEVYTKCQAVGTYNGWLPGNDLSNEASFLMMVDEDIYDEKQRMKVVESGLYTTVNMKTGDALNLQSAVLTAAGVLTANLGLLLAGLSTPVGSFLLSRRVEDHFAAATLKDSIKEMYQGPMVILGNAHIKPYDILGVADQMCGMNGLCEVKEITHTMSLQTGFVSTINPDCISTYLDYEGRDIYLWLAQTASNFLIGLATARFIGYLNQKLSHRIALRGVRRLDRWLSDQVRRGDEELLKKRGLTLDLAKTLSKGVKLQLNNLSTAVVQRNVAKIRDVLETIVADKELGKAFAAAPGYIKSEIQAQRILRSIPGKAGVKATVAKTGQAIDFLKGKFSDLELKAAQSAQTTEAELGAIRKKQLDLGGSPERVELIKKAAKDGKTLTAAEKEIVALAEQEAKLLKIFKVKGGTATLIKGTANSTSFLRSTFREALSKTSINATIAGVVTMAISSLSDYIVRWAIARQCLTIFPLKIYDKEFTAGIDGHRGAVAGDHLGNLDGIIQGSIDWFQLNLGGFSGVVPIMGDLIESGLDYQAKELPPLFEESDQN
jgi:hypothetical protein